MKLLCCHIQNYGKLSDFSYDFNENLSVILEENGWGKSTFASFIKAMLFGLVKTTKQDLDQNERAKYTPWQGGVMGGWLELELGGVPYRIERTFGKTKSGDKVNIFNLNTNQPLPDPDFIQNTLGMNADTFARSTFVEQGVFSQASNESIKAKLGKLIQNDNSFELQSVDDKLSKLQSEYQLQRGKGGKIPTIQAELDSTRLAISEAETAKASSEEIVLEMDTVRARIEAVTQNINSLRETQEKILKLKTEKATVAHFAGIVADVKKLGLEKAKILGELNDQPPTPQELEKVNEMNIEYEKAKTSLAIAMKNSPEDKLKKLQAYFYNGVPSEEELKEVNLVFQAYSAPTLSVTPKKKSVLKPALIFAGAGIMIAGAVLIVLQLLGVGITLACVGLIGALAGIFMPAKKASPNSEGVYISPEKEKLLNKVTDFVSRYNESVEFLEDSLYSIGSKRREYADLVENFEAYEEEKATLSARVSELNKGLGEYYSKFNAKNTDFTQSYNEIREKVARLEVINSQLEHKLAQQQDFLTTHEMGSIDCEHTEEEDNISEEVLRVQITEAENLKDQEQALLNTLSKKLDTHAQKVSALGYLKSKEAELEENLASLIHRHEMILKTREFLSLAKDNLTAEYLSPLCEAFKKYATKFLGRETAEITIDTDLEVRVEAMGAKRDKEYFSQGYRDIIELCLRLALIDVLFSGDLPPLILDDPFFNLDDEKTKNAMDLIKKISQDVQVIYLVCHSSRA